MRKSFFVILSFLIIGFYSCDDGDIITVELEFGETFEACEGVSSLVFYQTKSDPSESLSLIISGLTIEDILQVDENNIYENPITISGTNPFNYRTYNNTTLPIDLFCTDIPNSEVILIEDIEATSGTADIKTILTEDDNDGVPNQLESTNGINPIADNDNDGVLNYLDDAIDDSSIGDINGTIEDGFDTDGDGLPNYIDMDDDGDNVLTKDENPDPNGDGDLSDAQDTDNDGIPDYLDDDDDGDDTLTRDEEKGTQDQNLGNDITNGDVGPDYLNPDVDDKLPAIAFREHTINRTFTVTLIIYDIDLNVLSLGKLDFGILEPAYIPTEYKTRKITPDFN